MTKETWFAVKVAGLNALAFSITVAGVTYIDARLTSHVAFGARTYPYGYPIAIGGGSMVLVSTLLVLVRASSWKVRATVPAASLASMGIATLPFFLPEFPHGGISVWLAQFAIACLLTCYIHFLPWPAWLESEELGAAVKWERLKEYGVLWRTIAVAMTIGYMIILVPWSNFIWNQAPHIVRDPAEAYVLSEFGATGMVGVSVYVLLGILYESFRRAHEAADLALRFQVFSSDKGAGPVSHRLVRFEDFVLQLDATARGDFRARVIKSPFGEGSVAFSLPPLGSLAPDSLAIASRNLRPAPGPVVRPPLEIGAELYRAVFQGAVRSLLDKSRGQLEREADLGLRLKLKIDPTDPATGVLADLPWELLCDETEDCFALSRQTSVVRYLDVPRFSQPIPFTPPLKILAASASPRDLPALALDEEMRRLEELDRSGAGVQVRVLPHASASSIRQALAEDSWNVLHFMGHGTFDPATGDGGLACEAADGSLDLVSGRAFATKLRDLRSLGVVVLNACNTARAQTQGGVSPFRGVATALVLGGVPAVVAMQRPISDRAAIGFSTAFYRHLARGDSIDIALTEGRQAIHSARPDTCEWATPVLFLRLPEGNVFVARPSSGTPLPSAPGVLKLPRSTLL
jgi:CHAT domain-containing protein